MLKVIAMSWPLLLGVMMLMVGNGMQGSLLGIRGTLEGFATFELSVVMSAYFAGFLFGSLTVPAMIRRVGHVRVFAALGSLISAVLVVYPVAPDWLVWSALRMLSGFCFCGVYITAESWLNNTATNETRGQALSAYMIVQMIGIISSQVLLNVDEPTSFTLFVIPSVLVSLAFMPLLLADTPAPTFETIRRLSFPALWRISPLGCMGMLLTGAIFAAMFGMSSVWGAMAGLTVAQISTFVGAMYVGGLVLQYPIGWLSDRRDRRGLILWLSVAAAVVMLVAAVLPLPFVLLLPVAMVLGGITNPLYSLLIAYTNDFLKKEEMAGASSGLLFLNGLGAIFGPLATGWVMERIGPRGFFLFIAVNFVALAAYAAWRMTRRAAPGVSGTFATVSPSASALAVGMVMEEADEGPPQGRD
ncbi:MFS transporter [Gemmobacter lanyuensis]|uniref:MFS transporter n=1 Tax=Gemmobacter lanyuensis TaxID=1054497 RepID=A0A918IMH2_9RHOB|nr:MFS transporter [Gemmobacter lanyuensis]GGW22693.1 MFS transporter [Gemmobacter lanyuensis]